ncbi:MAG: hypothetical protein D6814_08915, partial [Calditrichaeota bacterium]
MFHVKQKLRPREMEQKAELRRIGQVLEAFGNPWPVEAEQKLWAFVELIRSGNQSTQLISRNDEPRLVQRHLRECLALPATISFKGFQRLLDLGSGAGLPGIPLAIVFPGIHFTLLEAKKKRALFLKKVQRELELDNVEI